MNNNYKDGKHVVAEPQGNEHFASWEEGDTRYLIVFIDPVAKARPRFTKAGRTYTPAKTTAYEKQIRTCWELAHNGVLMAEVGINCDFYVPIPKSWSKKKTLAAYNGEIRPTSRPDGDNYLKAVMDALNKVAYQDDAQIVSQHAEKYYALKGRVEISITDLGRQE